MNILIAVHGFPPTHISGAERTSERVAQWLVKNGHHVEVFTCEKLDDRNTRVETNVENGITVHRFYYDLKIGDYFTNLYNDPRLGAAFRKLLEHTSFDLVHIFSGYLLGGQVISTAKAFGLPVILTLTEFWFMCFRLNLLTVNMEMCVGPDSDEKCARCIMEDKRRYRLPAQKAPIVMDAFWTIAQNTPFAHEQIEAVAARRQTLQLALETVDLVICPSQFIISKFSEYKYNTSRFVHIRHGIKSHIKPPENMPKNSTGTLRLGYMGQLKSHKGIDLIVDAVSPLMEKNANVSVDIWGPRAHNSSYEKQLEQRTATYKSFRWAGAYTNDQLINVLSSFDVLVVPSRWYENSPAVILEAQAFGLPVIATRLGGMKELVQDEKNGLLFKLNDAKDLSNQIKRLIDDPSLLARLRTGIPPIPTIDDELNSIYAHYQRLTGKM